MAVRGATGAPTRRFKVRWKGYGAEDDTWEPFSNLPPHMIKEFLLANGEYEHADMESAAVYVTSPAKTPAGYVATYDTATASISAAPRLSKISKTGKRRKLHARKRKN